MKPRTPIFASISSTSKVSLNSMWKANDRKWRREEKRNWWRVLIWKNGLLLVSVICFVSCNYSASPSCFEHTILSIQLRLVLLFFLHRLRHKRLFHRRNHRVQAVVVCANSLPNSCLSNQRDDVYCWCSKTQILHVGDSSTTPFSSSFRTLVICIIWPSNGEKSTYFLSSSYDRLSAWMQLY